MSSPPHPPLKGRGGRIVHINSDRVGGRRPNRNNNNPLFSPSPEGGTWEKDKIINRRESRGIATTTTTTKTKTRTKTKTCFYPWCLIAFTDLNVWGGERRRGRWCWYRLPLVWEIDGTVLRRFGGGIEQGGLSLLSTPSPGHENPKKIKIFTPIVSFR